MLKREGEGVLEKLTPRVAQVNKIYDKLRRRGKCQEEK